MLVPNVTGHGRENNNWKQRGRGPANRGKSGFSNDKGRTGKSRHPVPEDAELAPEKARPTRRVEGFSRDRTRSMSCENGSPDCEQEQQEGKRAKTKRSVAPRGVRTALGLHDLGEIEASGKGKVVGKGLFHAGFPTAKVFKSTAIALSTSRLWSTIDGNFPGGKILRLSATLYVGYASSWVLTVERMSAAMLYAPRNPRRWTAGPFKFIISGATKRRGAESRNDKTTFLLRAGCPSRRR
ncbi:hypothetical protein B0H13DRAFT_1921749 [Mycena leptocephala]|nr:hypothetical protein B0H13DRAFT_1921749 [Mycena leptocephala]